MSATRRRRRGVTARVFSFSEPDSESESQATPSELRGNLRCASRRSRFGPLCHGRWGGAREVQVRLPTYTSVSYDAPPLAQSLVVSDHPGAA